MDLADRVDDRPVVVLADINMLRDRAKILNKTIQLIEYQGQKQGLAEGQLYVEHVPLNEDVVLGNLIHKTQPM